MNAATAGARSTHRRKRADRSWNGLCTNRKIFRARRGVEHRAGERQVRLEPRAAHRQHGERPARVHAEEESVQHRAERSQTGNDQVPAGPWLLARSGGRERVVEPHYIPAAVFYVRSQFFCFHMLVK
eukprot:gnl/Chilomastix_cuspidata/2144.p3 GENE.gnl/Chilomastix_cuspidata/2144~~gnl/Chilomastix_cuspidata/2144.p3  ORF type:complete len:127 (+),score=21.86 gnl/Chilomastix_cuspidata/2144:256-636(+)